MTDSASVDSLLEIVGELKDRVVDLEERAATKATPPPWSPCSTQEEVQFYANLACHS